MKTKLTEEQRKEVILKYKLDNSKTNIAKICSDYDITKQYIFKLAKSDRVKDIEQTIKENQNEFTKRANEIIKKALNRLENMIENDEKATISQVSTAIGILYDKSRLENNLSTENKSININIKVEK